MHIFIHEFMTGGGLFRTDWWPPQDSLLNEGRAMLTAIARDFAAIAGVQVSTLADARLPRSTDEPFDSRPVATLDEYNRSFAELAAGADWTLLIAPEIDGHLLSLAEQVEQGGGRLLGPSSDVIRLTSDKHATAEWLRHKRVPTPRGIVLRPQETPQDNVPYPAVLKPLDGAGSLGVRIVPSREDLPPIDRPHRLETYHAGIAASAACLGGPDGAWALMACRQDIADDGSFAYRGGEYPLPPALARRARWLALAAVQSLPVTKGYFGVDVILADDPTGRDDVVIEINPRLTTSYIGLRQASRVNLAEAMLAVAAGREPVLSWSHEPVQFKADGQITTKSRPI